MRKLGLALALTLMGSTSAHALPVSKVKVTHVFGDAKSYGGRLQATMAGKPVTVHFVAPGLSKPAHVRIGPPTREPLLSNQGTTKLTRREVARLVKTLKIQWRSSPVLSYMQRVGLGEHARDMQQLILDRPSR